MAGMGGKRSCDPLTVASTDICNGSRVAMIGARFRLSFGLASSGRPDAFLAVYVGRPVRPFMAEIGKIIVN